VLGGDYIDRKLKDGKSILTPGANLRMNRNLTGKGNWGNESHSFIMNIAVFEIFR
jgi:hypothetical protein